MKKSDIENIFIELEKSYSFVPVISKLKNSKTSAFQILITTMLSARTKDETTEIVANSLFSKISSPEELSKINIKELEKIIFKTGFYKVKAKNLINTSILIKNKFNGIVPDNLNDLLSLPGVGLKTANLTLIEAFNKNDICVDTHVHRISNRLGLVNTNTPEKTYYALKKVLDKKYWKKINRLMVSYGKTMCKPISPKCKICKLINICPASKLFIN